MRLLIHICVFLPVLWLASCDDDSSGPVMDSHSVESLVPSFGSKGSQVTVVGKGFASDTSRMKVFFNGRIARLLSASENELSVEVPSGAGPGFVTVHKDGVAVGGPYFDFIYIATVSTFSGSVQGYADGPAGSAKFNRPRGLAIDPQGNLMVADEGNQCIRLVFTNGSVVTFSGSGLSGHADGPPSSARFNQPYDIAFDEANQEYYVADKGNHCIRKLTVAGDVFTVAGIPATPGYVDGAATAARLEEPTGVAWKGELLNIFIADQGNHCIRRLDHQGLLSTFAGTNAIGFTDGTGQTARFNAPFDISWDSAGYYYVTDIVNQNIRRISESGEVSTVAGSGATGFADGPSVLAEFSGPRGISGHMGLVLICDSFNNRIRFLNNQRVSTIAGNGSIGTVNGIGAAASFNGPGGIVRNKQGVYFVTDTENHLIRKIVLE